MKKFGKTLLKQMEKILKPTNKKDLLILYQFLNQEDPLTTEYIELVELDLMDWMIDEKTGKLVFFLTPLGKEVAETI